MQTRSGGPAATVLLVEAGADRRATVESALADGDELAVRSATTVDAALEHLDGDGIPTDVDAVVTAERLPDGDAVELLERVRTRDEHLPIVCYPADGSGELASRVLAAGATDYASPDDVDGAELASRVREHVETARRRVDRRQHLEAIETAPVGVSILDEDGRFRYVNRAFANLYGYQRSDLVGEHWSMLYPEGEVERFEEEVAANVDAAGRWRGETIGLRADGTTFVEDHVLARTASGGFVCTVRDVTEERERERELHETSELLESVVEASPAALVAADRHGDLTLWNPAAERTFGWSEDEVLGEPIPFVPDDRRDEFWDLRERLLDGESITDLETQRVRKDGERIDVHMSIAPVEDEDGEVVGMTAAILDVTDRKQRERELRETTELLEAVVEASPAAIVAMDHDDEGRGEVELWNPAAEEIFGWSEAEALGEPLPFVPDDREAEHRDICERIGRGETIDGVETRRERKDGELIDVNTSVAPIRDSSGEVEAEMGAILDVTDRKERERELERTRELLADAERLADVGAWEWEPATGEVTWTEGTQRILEVSEDFSPTFESAIEFAHPEDTDRLRQRFQECLETGRIDPTTVRIVTASGRERWVRVQGERVADGDDVDEADDERTLVRGFVQDVTERRRRDQQVAVLDRVLRRNVRSDVEAIVDRAQTIAEYGEGPAADSASAIVDRGQQLRVLANKHREVAKLLSEPRSVHEYDVAAMLERVADQMRETYPRAEIELTLPRPADVVATADVEAAVAELVENAVVHGDADVPSVELDAEVERNAVQVTVADDGPGLPEAERLAIQRADEVEPLERDDGLGLWLARWIVSRAGGSMTVEDREPSGTEIRIRLPRTPVEPDLPRDDPGQPSDA